MQQVKFTGRTAEQIVAAAKALQAASKELNKHKKAAEAAKEVISRLIAQERNIVVDLLPDKEIVVIQADGQDAVEIKRKGSERFDQKAFSLEHADLEAKFTRPAIATYFDSLLS